MKIDPMLRKEKLYPDLVSKVLPLKLIELWIWIFWQNNSNGDESEMAHPRKKPSRPGVASNVDIDDRTLLVSRCRSRQEQMKRSRVSTLAGSTWTL